MPEQVDDDYINYVEDFDCRFLVTVKLSTCILMEKAQTFY